jgi:hypothetical protein
MAISAGLYGSENWVQREKDKQEVAAAAAVVVAAAAEGKDLW